MSDSNNINTLYPAFLKLNKLHTLIVGGGNVGFEKLSFILKNSPDAKITLIAPLIREEIIDLANKFDQIEVIKKAFDFSDLEGKRVVICATDNPELHKEIKAKTEELGILTNVADTPDLCDFYLGSIITKGDLKIAISTNGKSPTLAKRMRQYLEAALPNTTQNILDNLGKIRDQLTGDFNQKIEELNKVTDVLTSKNDNKE